MIRNKKLQELDLSLNSLIVFRRILVDPVIVPLRPLLDTETTDPIIQLRQYAEFTSRLFPQNMNLTEYLLNLVLEDDNFFMRMIARGEEPDDILQACVRNELSVIQRLATLKPVELMKEISYYGPLPEWKISKVDFAEVYFSRLAEIGKFGYGHFAKSTMFTVNGEKTVPVLHPDPIRLSDLFGYEAARNEVIDNTRALLQGKPAQNVLLYGDAGTGKSSTVKALVNEFASEGLRLIQITKEQLPQLPCILDSIYDNPLKFILFLDDLSFAAGDDSFGALKAILEGSVSAMPENAVFYATSNRRHIIRERFSDRGGDDIHRNDTIQEQYSLSARFGLRVNFGKPSKQEYLDIVLELAKRAGVSQETDALCMQAEQFALRSGGRSPRTAKQFIASLA
mgnify:CR=1 FL=1